MDVNQVGEIWCRGPNIMKGYLNSPSATNDCIDKDGYFHTGDIGYIDNDGYCYITDRMKELIKYKGFQVAPAELEGLLLTHPDIADCAVIGVYDSRRHSEIPKAFLVLKSQAKLGAVKAQEIVSWMNARVTKYKWLRGGAEIIDVIPKSMSGKILRRILRDMEKAKRSATSVRPKL